MPQRTIELVPTLRREAPWLVLMAGALLASTGLAHLLIRLGIILPSMATGGAPAWAWAALYTPEIVVAIMIGWRLRSWLLVLLYAGAAGLVREGFHAALRWSGDGSASAQSAAVELAVALPLAVAGYAVVFSLAASSGRVGAELPRDGLDADQGREGDAPRSGIVQR